MKNKRPIVVSGANLSLAWGKAFVECLRHRFNDQPLLVSVGGFDGELPHEDSDLRRAVDQTLRKTDCFSIHTTASLIFPYQAWCRRKKPGCEEFGKWYMHKLYPRLRERDSKNYRGTYFSRLVSYPLGVDSSGVNQLDKIIGFWFRSREKDRRPRRSALQAAIVDPLRDITGAAQSGFPCLQQIGITYDSDGGLILNAFYPSEYVFDRGYGNYLGLCWLGTFMAKQMGLRFSRLNCFIGVPYVGSPRKSELTVLAEEVIRYLSAAEANAEDQD